MAGEQAPGDEGLSETEFLSEITTAVTMLQLKLEGMAAARKALQQRLDAQQQKLEAAERELAADGQRYNQMEGQMGRLVDRLTELEYDHWLTQRNRRRTALAAARREACTRLRRYKPADTSWRDFVQSFTAEDRRRLGLSPAAVEMLATAGIDFQGQDISSELVGVAEAVCAAQRRHSEWKEIFRFSYKKNADEVAALWDPRDASAGGDSQA